LLTRAYQIHNQEAIYFLTFRVVNWADIFSRQKYRDIIIESLLFYQKNRGLLIFAYVIMTNHVHVIWKASDNNLSDLIRDFKKYTAKLIINDLKGNYRESRREWLLALFRNQGTYNSRNREFQFWRQYNHAIELNNNLWIDQKINYIHNNPVKAGIVEKPEEFIYSSAKYFVFGDGMIRIDEL
jgi:putative transposase